jgi:DNA-directed RNA polymerase specialized sigma24 family protein
MELQRLARAWYVDGLTVRGAATRLGCSTTTVPKRLDDLRLNVQVWWAQQAREKNHFGV